MVRIKTLYTLLDLQKSGFGRPYPRHGLNLLYWFANRCVEVSYWNLITVLYDPETNVYGFRRFHNNEGLLPATNLPYYEVGNLNHDEARNLPLYIKEENTGDVDNSNADRIIICVGRFSISVYVTSHSNQWTFNPNQTFQISPQLLRIIRSMEREDFLKQTTSVINYVRESVKECCKMLNRVLMFITIVFYLFIFFLGKKEEANSTKFP